jgi:hypothetical protein
MATALTTLSTVSAGEAMVTSNHASHTNCAAVMRNAVGARYDRRANSHAAATRLISSIVSNPTQARSQWPTT